MLCSIFLVTYKLYKSGGVYVNAIYSLILVGPPPPPKKKKSYRKE